MSEVIRQQIDGAIDLLVRFDNLTGAYLLASTAISNLWKTAKAEDIKLPLDLSRIARERRPEMEAELMYRFNQAYNEIKHIGSSDFTTHLNPKLVEANTLTATLTYNHFFDATTPNMAIYSNWMMHRHPNMQGPDFEPIKDFDELHEGLSRKKRTSFAKALLERHDRDPETLQEMIELVRKVRAFKIPTKSYSDNA